MPTMVSRSPSPNPSRVLNPSPRTPDGISNRRNSCSEPSNPNSDAHQRNSCRTGCVAAAASSPRASFEHKENAVGRSRSPAMSSSSKVAKNFMSPTISASSKVTAASPRRKVLGEKNEEGVRSSLASFPAAPPMPSADEALVKPDAGLGIPHALRDAEQMPKISSDVEPISPLDADPRLPPYDPETNYLSPRPRFLHYRPNPRIESSVHCGRSILEANDGRRLDGSFSSEIHEESFIPSKEEDSSDPGEEQSPDPEEQSSEPKEEYEEQFPGPQGDCEEQFPDPQDDCDEQSSDQQSECQEVTSFPGENVVPQVATKSSRGSTSLRYKFAPVLLVTVMACLLTFFWGTSLMSSSSFLLNAPTLQIVNDLRIGEHAINSAMHVKELTSRLRHSAFGTFGLFSMSATLPEYGPFYAANLTAAASADHEVSTYDSYKWTAQISEHTVEGTEQEQSYWEPVEEEIIEKNMLEIDAKDAGLFVGESMQEPEVERQDAGVVEEESMHKSEMERPLEVDVSGDAEILEEEGMDVSANGLGVRVEAENVEVEVGNNHETLEGQEEEGMDVSANGLGVRVEAENVEVEVGNNHETLEGQEDAAATQFQLSGSDASNSGSSDDNEIDHEIFNGLKPRDFFGYAYDSEQSNRLLFMGISSAALLLAAAIFIFLSRKKRQMSVVLDASEAITTTTPPAQLRKELAASGSDYSYVQNNSDSPRHDTPVDVMMVDDSGPSESSTGLQQSRSVGRRRAATRASDDENSNIERQARRDSLASSASISYGSYTTFEKLSAKKGPRDDEAMTPVRRSSRIRSQIASP